MKPRYCIDPPRILFEKLLPQGPLTEWPSLWLWPKGIRFSGEELKRISDAFADRRMAIWKANKYWEAALEHLRKKPEVLQRLDQSGAFASCSQLVEGKICRSVMQFGPGAPEIDKTQKEAFYSDVVWANVSELAAMADPFLGWRLGSNSALGFLRDGDNQPHLWARLFQSVGFHGLALRAATNQKGLCTHDLKKELENRKLEYLTFVVSLCASAGIMASLVCEDTETKSALVFWGRKEELQNAASGLAEPFQSMDVAEMESWLRRGTSFVLSA